MNACQTILENKDAIYIVAGLAYAGLEFWLGKTDKVQAASAIEALLGPFVKPKSPEDTNGKSI